MKVLIWILKQMEIRIKYPRTFHIIGSPGMTNDDKLLTDYSRLEGMNVIVTEKMDGENTTLYRDGFHARSIDGRHHPSRNWVSRFHSMIANDIPSGFRICGENMYARHSIGYLNLPSYFMGFSVWDNDTCLSWEETEYWFSLLGISPVPILWTGLFSMAAIQSLINDLDVNTQEGIVVRPTRSFELNDFSKVVCKWVRINHVQTESHWMRNTIIPNRLIY